MKKLSDYKEVETKYQAKGQDLPLFKKLISGLPGLQKFVYAESDDIYYKNDRGEFLRYRTPEHPGPNSKCELTKKIKTEDKNNFVRVEVNLNVESNDRATVQAFVESLGYKKNFTIGKAAYIYIFQDATVPFYSVTDESGSVSHFIEIEVDEDLASNISIERCWQIIEKYEKILEPLGVGPRNRLKKSLLEIYQKD